MLVVGREGNYRLDSGVIICGFRKFEEVESVVFWEVPNLSDGKG